MVNSREQTHRCENPVTVRRRPELHRGPVCRVGGNAHSGQSAERFASRAHRAIPSLFQRSVSHQSGQTADVVLTALHPVPAGRPPAGRPSAGRARSGRAVAGLGACIPRQRVTAGTQIPVAPGELTLRFTEPEEPLFCAVALLGPRGAAIRAAAPRADGQTLVVRLPELTPGTDTIVWQVTSVDTHKTEGRYQFTIGF